MSKDYRIRNGFILSVLMLLMLVPAYSQYKIGSNYDSKEDSITCGKHISAYRTFFNLELYYDAHSKWLKAFNDCPVISEMMYLDGVTMFRFFIESSPDGPLKEGRIDTLLLIYDRRMEYFGGEGNILGRKGRALLTYRGKDIEQVQNAYDLLKRSIELEGKQSRETIMLNVISAGIKLNKEEVIDDIQLMGDYIMVISILDQNEGSSRSERTRGTIDEIMQKEDIISCEALNRYYETLLEQNKDDLTFLKQVIRIYSSSGCDRSNIYLAAAENLYEIEPNSESAHNLAIMYISRNDFPKAVKYLKMAVLGENIDNETRSEWFYELAVVSNANEDYCDAITYAREAIAHNSNSGKAYMILGDAIIASRDKLGDDLQQRSAFWLAADKYLKAASVDPSLAAEAMQKLSDYATQYPSQEDVFFQDLKEGDPYLVGGCINENTTIRSRK